MPYKPSNVVASAFKVATDAEETQMIKDYMDNEVEIDLSRDFEVPDQTFTEIVRTVFDPVTRIQ